jgi:hypothetical protein
VTKKGMVDKTLGLVNSTKHNNSQDSQDRRSDRSGGRHLTIIIDYLMVATLFSPASCAAARLVALAWWPSVVAHHRQNLG